MACCHPHVLSAPSALDHYRAAAVDKWDSCRSANFLVNGRGRWSGKIAGLTERGELILIIRSLNLAMLPINGRIK